MSVLQIDGGFFGSLLNIEGVFLDCNRDLELLRYLSKWIIELSHGRKGNKSMHKVKLAC